MRSFIERNVAKNMTCRSVIASSFKELGANPGRAMAGIQSAVVSFFGHHPITKFVLGVHSQTLDGERERG